METKQLDKKENKLGVMPVNKLLINMGFPIIISMMMQALYNIIDSIFVGQISENATQALNALTLAFPAQMIMVAIAIGTGVGVNALLSLSLGQKDYKKASIVTANAMIIALIIYIVYLFFALFLLNFYIKAQTSDSIVSSMVRKYLMICCVLSMGIVYFAVFEKILQATGNALYSTIAQLSGAVINIILDPICIFGIGFIAPMGISGAAIATVIGQLFSAVLGLIFHLKKNKDIKNKLFYYKLDLRIVKAIYSIGLPAIIAQALMSVMTYAMNLILGQIDALAVISYGLYYKIQQFVLFAAFGLRDAITPVLSFNYGAKDNKRVKETIKFGLIYTIIIMLVGLVLVELLADKFALAFSLSGSGRQMFVNAVRIISLSFIFAGLNVSFQGIFQALKGGFESLLISLLRQFVIVLPLAYGFSLIAKENVEKIYLVWASFIIAEFVTFLVALVLMKKIKIKRGI